MNENEESSLPRNTSFNNRLTKMMVQRRRFFVFCILGVMLLFGLLLKGNTKASYAEKLVSVAYNSQSIEVLRAPTALELPKAVGGPDPDMYISGDAMVAQTGPLGTQADVISGGGEGQITTYVVNEGDNISLIAEMFGVSTNTIRWQNDLDHKALIRPGQKLVILEVDGVSHTVRKGDTLASVAKKYQGDIEEIRQFNNISGDSLIIGSTVVVPGGEPIESKPPAPVKKEAPVVASKPVTPAPKKSVTPVVNNKGLYKYPLPVGACTETQSYHGRWRAKDYGCRTGTPIYAAADGKVAIDTGAGWNGGYGVYVVLKHSNGASTLYAHMTENVVALGQYVNQGDLIGYVGSTGRSTGPHLHFEMRNAKMDIPSW